MHRRILAVHAIVLASAIGCGKSSPSTPSPTPTTETFTGTARAIGPGNCTGDSHNFTAAAGTISVTLVQTTPAENMTAQICSVASSQDCSMTRRQINVGQTLEVPRNSLTTQTLSLLPLTCGTSAAPSPNPIAYNVTVRYSK